MQISDIADAILKIGLAVITAIALVGLAIFVLWLFNRALRDSIERVWELLTDPITGRARHRISEIHRLTSELADAEDKLDEATHLRELLVRIHAIDQASPALPTAIRTQLDTLFPAPDTVASPADTVAPAPAPTAISMTKTI